MNDKNFMCIFVECYKLRRKSLSNSSDYLISFPPCFFLPFLYILTGYSKSPNHFFIILNRRRRLLINIYALFFLPRLPPLRPSKLLSSSVFLIAIPRPVLRLEMKQKTKTGLFLWRRSFWNIQWCYYYYSHPNWFLWPISDHFQLHFLPLSV